MNERADELARQAIADVRNASAAREYQNRAAW